MKIRPARAGMFHANGLTDRRTDIMTLIVAFRNFANASKIEISTLFSRFTQSFSSRVLPFKEQ